MKAEKTSITQKYQTTIPKNIRKLLRVKAGEDVEWHVVRSMVVLHKKESLKDPVKFLTSQIKLSLDAAKLSYNISGIDYIHIATMEINAVKKVISADVELDKVDSIQRVDPLEDWTNLK